MSGNERYLAVMRETDQNVSTLDCARIRVPGMDNMCLQYATAYSLNRDETSLVILHATDIKRRLVQAWRTLSLSTVVMFGPPENPSEMTLSSLLELERVTDQTEF